MIPLETLPKRAEKRKKVWKSFFNKHKKRLMKMDVEIQAIHEEVEAEINCLECANCCQSLGPRLTQKDIDKMAKSQHIKTSIFEQQYIKIDHEGDAIFNTLPCPFLCTDNYCNIYPHRPRACREYPHTDRKRFYQIFNLTIKNAYFCPIAYQVLETIVLRHTPK